MFVAVAVHAVKQSGSLAGKTVTVDVAVPVPHDPVPVTVYVVVVAGETFTVAVVIPPGLQEYVFPPVAVKVAVSPGQMVALFTVIGVKIPQLTWAVPKKLSGTEVVAEERATKKKDAKAASSAVKKVKDSVEKSTLGDLDVLAQLKSQMESNEKKG